ncbi:ribbon-helix-helix protein, CopG family [Microbispora cellulosiformans]|uniref:Ribbon-helix-helix protein, CopG family n=1 Tax=Microbispora cellulosiformans TaxID=2614688 RepID=A0A5J5K7D2_9ACTN|nr:ribbon-helix-helix protein, CopG family [Microbispora cellulosiformans]KAA9380685.1 ribbon-helix-helix protein, CopG family [Microbispora cellulosiformans]
MSSEPRHTTIRVSVETRDLIARLSEQEGKSMTALVEDAVREHRKKLRWQRVAGQIERTRREDPESWAEYVAERELWLGPSSNRTRIAPEWEGLLDLPEDLPHESKERDEG